MCLQVWEVHHVADTPYCRQINVVFDTIDTELLIHLLKEFEDYAGAAKGCIRIGTILVINDANSFVIYANQVMVNYQNVNTFFLDRA